MATTLQEARLEVMKAVGYVQKVKGKAGGLSYSYASETDLIAALRPAMIEAGITMSPGDVLDLRTEDWSKDKRNGCVLMIRQFIFRFQRPDGTLESDTVTVAGEGSDFGDKRAGKAMTYAKKYALREYFLIETGDDPDQVKVDREQAVGAVEHMAKKFAQNLRSATTPEELQERWEKVVFNRAVLTDSAMAEMDKLHKEMHKKLGAAAKS